MSHDESTTCPPSSLIRSIQVPTALGDPGKWPRLHIVSRDDLHGGHFVATMAGRQAETFMEVVAQSLRGGACLTATIRAKCAKDIMTSPAIIVNGQTLVLEVAKMITIKKINGARIVDQDARMEGIISRADLLE